MSEILVEILACFVIIFTSFATIVLINKSTQVKQLKEEKLLIERSRDRWENYYRDYIQRLEMRIDRLTKEKIYGEEMPPDTIKAVKYAMTRAHPDNGGKEEDFIKFQEVYEKLTGK